MLVLDGGRKIAALFMEGDPKCLIDGEIVEHKGEVVNINGKLMIPLRVIVEKFLKKSLNYNNGELVIRPY